MPDSSLILGMWQDSGVLGDVEGNVAIINETAGQARSRGVDLLVFPECFLTGYYNREDTREAAAKVTQSVHDRLAAVAREHEIALLVGYAETTREGVANAAILLDETGRTIANYRKRTLFGEWEQAVFVPGTQPAIVDFHGIRLGILICFDLEFPELTRELARQKVDVILVPTALMASHDFIATTMVATRAFENQLYVAYANRIGREHELTFVGQSVICDPLGIAVAQASAGRPELLTAKIEKSRITEVRAPYSYLAHAGDLPRL